MPVDVSYEGIVLARGAQVKQTPAGLFLALEPPMPVGTLLHAGDSPVRVARVHEGAGSGVIVVAVGEVALPAADVEVAAEEPPPSSARHNVPAEAARSTSEKLAAAAPRVARGADGPLHDDGRVTQPGLVAEAKPEENVPVTVEDRRATVPSLVAEAKLTDNVPVPVDVEAAGSGEVSEDTDKSGEVARRGGGRRGRSKKNRSQ